MYLSHNNYATLTKKVNRLNNRLSKKGLPLIVLSAEEKSVRVLDIFPNILKKVSIHPDTMISIMDVELSSDFTKVQIETGYEFIGVIDHTENLISCFVEGVDIERFRDRHVCDHCKTRRNRTKTVILRKDGELYQIGTKCLSDFFSLDVKELIQSLELMSSNLFAEDNESDYVKDYSEYFGCGSYYSLPLETVLAHAYRQIQKYGFIPSSEGANSTRYALVEELFHFNKAFYVEVTDEDMSVASKIAEYMLTLPSDSSFNNNLRQIAKNGQVSTKSIGYIPAIVNSYLKDQVKVSEHKESSFYGFPGMKIEREVVLSNVYNYETTFNYRTVWCSILTFVDNEGNVFVWKTTSDFDLERGKTYTVKCSIKEHSEYKNVKQTVVTRVKVIK